MGFWWVFFFFGFGKAVGCEFGDVFVGRFRLLVSMEDGRVGRWRV